MPIPNLEDDEDVELAQVTGSMPGGVPNIPRNPDAEPMGGRRRGGEYAASQEIGIEEDPIAKIKQYLARQESPEQQAARGEAMAGLRESNRNLSLAALLNQAANAAGTIGGKQASSEPVNAITAKGIEQNRGMMQGLEGQEEKNLKIRQYLADKMISNEEKEARRLAQKQNYELRKREVAAHEKEANIKNQPPTELQAKSLTDQGKPMSGEQAKAQSALERANRSAETLDTIASQEDFNPENLASVHNRIQTWKGLKDIPIIGGLTGMLGNLAIQGVGGSGGAIQQLSPSERKYLNEAENFIRAKLRKESGASISTGEFAGEYERFFPMPGDTPETLAAKKDARNAEIAGMRIESGKLGQPIYGEEGYTSLAKTEPTKAPQPGNNPGAQGKPTMGAISGGDEVTGIVEQMPGEGGMKQKKIKEYLMKKKGLSDF